MSDNNNAKRGLRNASAQSLYLSGIMSLEDGIYGKDTYVNT